MDNYGSNFSECYYPAPLSQKTNATNWSECESRGPCLYPQNGIQSSLGYSLGKTTSTATSTCEEMTLSVMAGPKNKIKAELKNDELWNVFRENETEMIITRAGRRMFPILDFRLSGMEANQYYSCMVQIVSIDNHHYRYDLTNDKWVVTGSAVKLDVQHSRCLHPHGSTLGRVWMKEGAKFDKLKLSNNVKPYCDYIILSSLQKYKAQLIVTRLDLPHCERWIFDFPETAFIAVTCYQNPTITRLKIEHNPFAKAFRQGKRSMNQDEDTEKQNRSCNSTKSTKRPRLQISSPPPVTRLHPPPLGHFPETVPSIPTPPPPPLPPMNLYCQSYPSRETMVNQQSRFIPLMNDPILWEPPQASMTSQRTCLPPINTSFHFEAPQPQCLKQEHQTCTNVPQTWFSDQQDVCGNLYGTNWVPTNSCSLYEDIQLRHHGYDNMFYREN
ncbi:T-box transcription factor TBX10-like [Actinia tenebrosa]|uniref:T-box transcription factor TBX10-like n=1 Tax=Actinia tenebrosa TaxID=6105 RepID=A0A6P8I1K9_ACTTE|nr:T-box transcription factor TBX10-like [Actinia tenebrosa]